MEKLRVKTNPIHAQQEISILLALDHRNVAKVYDIIMEQDTLYMVTDLYENSLQRELQKPG